VPQSLNAQKFRLKNSPQNPPASKRVKGDPNRRKVSPNLSYGLFVASNVWPAKANEKFENDNGIRKWNGKGKRKGIEKGKEKRKMEWSRKNRIRRTKEKSGPSAP